jgi:hypothetical protein
MEPEGLLADDIDSEEDDAVVTKKQHGPRGTYSRWVGKVVVFFGFKNSIVMYEYALYTLVSTLVGAGLFMGIGFLVGHSIASHGSSAGNQSSVSNASVVGYDWGDIVEVDGRSEDVLNYFGTHLSAEDIREYLS